MCLSSLFKNHDNDALLQQLYNEFGQAYNEGRAANESRYAQILEGYGDRHQAASDKLQGLGDAARNDLNRRYQNLATNVDQNLASRGLYNSTIAGTMQRGITDQQDRAMNQLNEGLRREQIGYDTALSGDTLAFMERRNDTYPDLNQMANLALQMGNTSGNRQSIPSQYRESNTSRYVRNPVTYSYRYTY